ncbi:MAG TPA: hypothetical protein VNO21_27930 [Polyangiaceae bacterium]|nr:hypothetical protein [Polyangiaceae bacterium]
MALKNSWTFRALVAASCRFGITAALFGVAACGSQTDGSETSISSDTQGAKANSTSQEIVEAAAVADVTFGQMCLDHSSNNGCLIHGYPPSGKSASYAYGTRPVLISWNGHSGDNERIIIGTDFRVYHMVSGWSTWSPLRDKQTVHDWLGATGGTRATLHVDGEANGTDTGLWEIFGTGPDVWSAWLAP